MRNQVQLIAYADRLAGDFAGLSRLLTDDLAGLFGGVHVLPFFTPIDGADAGFDPDDHTVVDPRLGSWDDVRQLVRNLDVVVDVIVNHVSVRSPQFLDWVANGDASPYADMFLTMAAVFPDGATENDLLGLYRPRPGLPFTPVAMADGSRRLAWTTFSSAQVDIDVHSAPGRAYLRSVLDRLAEVGAASVRLDAVGYAVKTSGTSSFMTSHTFDFIDELSGMCRERGVQVLVEVHSYYQSQIEIARKVDLVYDFALPPLVLHGLIAGDPHPLHRWLQVRPRNCVTVLDTHDGIGVIDVGVDPEDSTREGLLTPAQIYDLVESMHDNSGGTSRLATGAASPNADFYQVNCTYYDALARDDDAYLIARALQFFTPGIPQVYYVGLFAGTNDMDLLARTNVGRDVNRRYYTSEQVKAEMQRPVVAALRRLIAFRSWHSAFDGEFTATVDGGEIVMAWRGENESARLDADLTARTASLSWTENGAQRSVASLLDLPDVLGVR
ncbi:MAG: sucrose phosphorylase [Jiangellales bacterium]